MEKPLFKRMSPPMLTRTIRGLSLVELMVALVLGMLVIAGVLQLFGGSKLAYQSNQALARVQENGRFSMEILKREMREAGTHGFCAAQLNVNNHLRSGCANHVDSIFDANRAIVGWEYVGTGRGESFDDIEEESDLSPAGQPRGAWRSTFLDAGAVLQIDLPEFLANRVVPGSDVIVMRRLVPVPGVTGATPPPPNNPNSASINLSGNHGLEQNEIILVTNCTTGADLFQNRSNANANVLSSGTGNCSNPGPGNDNSVNWSTSYDDTMQIFRVQIIAYYVGYNAARGEPGLYRATLSRGTADANVVHEELVEGVETMQLLYGYSRPADQGGDGQTVNDWLAANEVPNWDFIISVRMALVVRSSETDGGDRQRATFDLVSTTFQSPDDRRLRQQFSATLSLRNRQLVL